MIDNDNSTSTSGTNTKKILQDLKRDQEEFYSRISKIAQTDIATSPPFNQQFEKILQNSAKRIAGIDKELKMLDDTVEQEQSTPVQQQQEQEQEQQRSDLLIKLRDTGDDNEMIAVRADKKEEEENRKKEQDKNNKK